jgi:hypothetical protein
VLGMPIEKSPFRAVPFRTNFPRSRSRDRVKLAASLDLPKLQELASHGFIGMP